MPDIVYIFAVDGGGTKTEAALLRCSGEALARCRTGSCNLYQDRTGGLAAIGAAWQQCCQIAGIDGNQAAAGTCLSAGVAGVNAVGAKEDFRDAFRGFAQRRLSSDGYTALIGAFAAAPGALLSLGTGVVGYRLDAAGHFWMLSGWGFPIGDRGGGAWLGQRLVGDWLEARDGYGPLAADDPLAAAAQAVIGDERGEILAWLKTAKPSDFAKLARPVIEAAHAGNAYAVALLDAAQAEVLRVAHALAPTEAEPLVLGGGLAPVYASRLEKALGAERLAKDRTASPVEGAWLVGVGQAKAEFPEIE